MVCEAVSVRQTRAKIRETTKKRGLGFGASLRGDEKEEEKKKKILQPAKEGGTGKLSKKPQWTAKQLFQVTLLS